MWNLLCVVPGSGRVIRRVEYDEKPSSLMLGDYLDIRGVNQILDKGRFVEALDRYWILEEKKAPEPSEEDKATVAAIRRVMDKNTLYRLCYSASDPTAAIWMDFAEIIGKITYKPGWYFRVGVETGRMWVQVGVTEDAEIAFDPIEGNRVPWRGAKHYLSEHMCRQEVVGTVYHAIERAEMHEFNEWFRYKGRSIYNPHIDPDVLVKVASKRKNFNTRKNAMTMEES